MASCFTGSARRDAARPNKPPAEPNPVGRPGKTTGCATTHHHACEFVVVLLACPGDGSAASRPIRKGHSVQWSDTHYAYGSTFIHTCMLNACSETPRGQTTCRGGRRRTRLGPVAPIVFTKCALFRPVPSRITLSPPLPGHPNSEKGLALCSRLLGSPVEKWLHMQPCVWVEGLPGGCTRRGARPAACRVLPLPMLGMPSTTQAI